MKQFYEINEAMSSCNLVQEISICLERETGRADLRLYLVDKPFSSHGFSFVFRDIADFKCHLGLGGGWTQVNMLGIREVQEGYERPLVVREIECENLSFRCKSLDLLG